MHALLVLLATTLLAVAPARGDPVPAPLVQTVAGQRPLSGDVSATTEDGQRAANVEAARAIRARERPDAVPPPAQQGSAAADPLRGDAVAAAAYFGERPTPAPHIGAARQTFTLPPVAPNTCVDIRSKGGVTDGVTDDTAALMLAVAAGSCVHVPAGQTAICNPVITKSNLTIIGDASQGSVFVPTSPTCSGLQFGTASKGVTDVFVRSVGYVAPARQPSGTFAFNFLNTFHSGWEDIYVRNAYDGVILTGGLYGNGGAFRNTGHDVIQINGGNDRYITKVVADTEDGIPAHAGVAIYASNGSDVIVDNDFIHTGTGLLIAPSHGAYVEWPFLENDAFDSCSDDQSTRGPAISISPSGAGSYVRGGVFTQMWASTCAQGVLINPTDGAYVDNILFQGLRAFNNDRDGVLLDGGSDIEFDGALVNTNSKMNPGVFAGINVQSNVGDVRIIGGSFGKTKSETRSNQLRGVIFQPGYFANAIVIGARFCGLYPDGKGLFLGTGGAGVNYQHGFNVCE